MMKARCYSPQLSPAVVRRLYFKAKILGIPMTVLANRLVEEALAADQVIECRRETASDGVASGERAAAPAKSPVIAPR